MNYIYHQMPKHLEGTTLYPLNMLKDKHPDLYKNIVMKYEQRPHIMQMTIPVLGGCLWNDVLHFSPVHPAHVANALRDSGLELPPMHFFQFDADLFAPECTTIYLFNKKDSTAENKPENFATYSNENIEKYSRLPKETVEYYDEMKSKKILPLMFKHIPHVLYKGSIDISNVPIIIV